MSVNISLKFQIERVVLFLLEQQGQLATRLSELRDQHDTLTQNLDGSNFSELLEAYREVGRDLLRLLFFVEMNVIGLRKILKKFDKRFGFKFTNYYVKTRANHPYSQLRQVIKQVVKKTLLCICILNLITFLIFCTYFYFSFLDVTFLSSYILYNMELRSYIEPSLFYPCSIA